MLLTCFACSSTELAECSELLGLHVVREATHGARCVSAACLQTPVY